MADLEHSTIEDIVDELERRTDALVLGYVKDAPTGDTQQDFVLWYRGGLTMCIGIAARATNGLQNHAKMMEGDHDDAD